MKRYTDLTDYNANYGVVSKWACKHYELRIGDLQLLWYLKSASPFLMEDFKDGTLLYAWDSNRFYKLKNAGWITTLAGKGEVNLRAGDHFKYTTTSKTSNMIRRLDRILQGHEDIPMSQRRNRLLNEKAPYQERRLAKSLKKYQRTKDKYNKWD